MIKVIGLDSDRTVIHFLAHARRAGVAAELLNLREIAASGHWRLSIPDDGCSWLRTAGSTFALDPDASYYCRIIDLSSVMDKPEQAVRARCLASTLNNWLEHIPGIVINRPGIPSDNFSKPLHEATLAAARFRVPPSLTSSDKYELRRFAGSAPTIVKAVSGVLSTTRMVEEREFADFDPRQGPVHLQRYVRGWDVRAHVVGDDVIAERIVSSGIDYRRGAELTRYEPCRLPDEMRQRVVSTTKGFGLTFMGWDFKVDTDEEYWCLEANPMPGYNFYDEHAGYRITEALLGALTPMTSDEPTASERGSGT